MWVIVSSSPCSSEENKIERVLSLVNSRAYRKPTPPGWTSRYSVASLCHFQGMVRCFSALPAKAIPLQPVSSPPLSPRSGSVSPLPSFLPATSVFIPCTQYQTSLLFKKRCSALYTPPILLLLLLMSVHQLCMLFTILLKNLELILYFCHLFCHFTVLESSAASKRLIGWLFLACPPLLPYFAPFIIE